MHRPKETARAAPALPTPANFRDWLKKSLADLDMTPARLSRDAALSVNTAGRILKGNDLTLGTASALERCLLDEAARSGVTLRRLDQLGEGEA